MKFRSSRHSSKDALEEEKKTRVSQICIYLRLDFSSLESEEKKKEKAQRKNTIPWAGAKLSEKKPRNSRRDRGVFQRKGEIGKILLLSERGQGNA